jgi:hypothetical protein
MIAHATATSGVDSLVAPTRRFPVDPVARAIAMPAWAPS